MGDDALKTQKLRAEDNAWFLLATLYGQPRDDAELDNAELILKNFQSWNRYMANAIPPDLREKLVAEGRYSAEELTPSPASEIELAYLERHIQAGSAASRAIPSVEPCCTIDFSNLEFDKPLYFFRFFFPKLITFERASFSRVDFDSAIFLEGASFSGAIFSKQA